MRSTAGKTDAFPIIVVKNKDFTVIVTVKSVKNKMRLP